jgi:Bacterial SH3 domain
MSRLRILLIITVPVLMASCSSRASGPPAIAEAFAGPSSLPIRQDLTLQSPVVATVKHGDRLEILQNRRRFVQVRTPQGAVGWTDNRQLLTPEQMLDIRRFAEATVGLPSEGAATAFEPVNVHTEPSRTSPSFLQVPENERLQVIGHKLAPRTTPAPERAASPPKKGLRNSKKSREKEKEARRIAPPPMPAPPKLPSNWMELSRSASANSSGRTAIGESSEPVRTAKAPVMEDWSLVRSKDNKVGWVLSRMLTMSIPDEVAQYAEGHRITSYFALSDMPDEGQTKHGWLWTTISHGGQPFEFDGFRVFIWSLRHHRYETVYRERDLKGFYPVSATKSPDLKKENAAFSVVVDVDGQLIRKTYAFNGYRVNLLRKEPYAPQPQAIQIAGGSHSTAQVSEQRPPAQPWYARFGARMRSLFQ